MGNVFFKSIFFSFNIFLLIRLIISYLVKTYLKCVDYTNQLSFQQSLNRKFNILKIVYSLLKLDFIFLNYLKKKFNIYYNFLSTFRINYRINQANWKFYQNSHVEFSSAKDLFTLYLFGLKSLWIGLRFWFIGILLFSASFFYLSYIRLLPFNKVLFEWILITMFVYWLLSGFVFFIKKYQYSKFTSIIQRFWKRSYILFWLIESGIFLCFFYLTINATAEPMYMYDQIRIYKTHLFSWRWFLLKIIPLIGLIILTYYTHLSLKWNIFNKLSIFFLLITCLLLYIVWLEFYQFFHIINFYGNLNWVYDTDEFLWNLEIEFRRTRLFNNYVMVCLIAKFWHLIFIFVFWVFFVLRVNEIGRVRYPLFSANFQNFLILYMMSWLYMLPWLKFLFRKQLDTPYHWFFINNRLLGFRLFFYDLKLFYSSVFTRIWFFSDITNNNLSSDFFYWIESSTLLDFNQYRKHIFRDLILSNLNVY